MAKIRLPNNWQPREYQVSLWDYLENGGKRAIAIWHRRAGKDEVCLHYTATQVIQKPAMYWHMLPEASQARKAIWDAINPHTGHRRIDEAFPHEIRASTRDNDMFIRFINGATWQVVGSDNFKSLIGTPPVGLTVSEWAIAKPEAWAYLRPILRENDGWAAFISSPRGKNHAYNMFNMAANESHWFSELLTVDDTGIFTQKQLEEERRELIAECGEALGNAFFMQEYYCSWSPAHPGKLVYPEFNRRLHVATEPLLPIVKEGLNNGRACIRGWDNTGLSPACVLTYVNTLGQWYVFKEFCGSDIDMVDFGDWVKIWCGENLPAHTEYRDIGDPAGRIRDTRKTSPAQYLEKECGIRIEDGVQTFKIRRSSVANRLTKLVQGQPAIVIDSGCDMLIEGFAGGYVFPEIGKTGIHKTEPEKNEFSHCLVKDSKISMLFGYKKIENINVGDYVETPIGYKRVSAVMSSKRSVLTLTTSDNKMLTCSKDHPIYTDSKIVLAGDLQHTDCLATKCSQEDLIWSKKLKTRSKSLTASSFTKSLKGTLRQITTNMELSTCTDMCRSFIVGKFRKITSFIIKTGTKLTTDIKIYLLSCLRIMQETTALNASMPTQNHSIGLFRQQEKKQKNGINRKMVENGTGSMARKHGQKERKHHLSAQSAEKNIRRINLVENGDFVRKAVSKKQEDSQELMMKFVNVLYVTKRFLLTSIKKQKPAPVLAKTDCLIEKKRVYDLTVEDAHCFYANNILVGNSHDALQYPATVLFASGDDFMGAMDFERHDYTPERLQGRNRHTGY